VAGRRIIEINESVIRPVSPKPNTVRPRKRSDFPEVQAVHLDAAEKLSNPFIMGPPLCDEFIALIQHLFTEEEAGVVRHLGVIRGKSPAVVARAEHRPVEEVEPILRRLAFEKRVIIASGPEGKKTYRLMQLFPGIFEMALIGEKPETMSPWHRRFAELFEALFETGYFLEYKGTSPQSVRYLPVGGSIGAGAAALPFDRLEEVLDKFKVFGVGQCQCRMTAEIVGQGCGKPVSNCALMGEWAQEGIKWGWLKEVSKKEMLEIKAEAEAHSLVNWMINIGSAKGQSSCSCCGCCCKGMRFVNEFNAPGVIAPPHFIPELDAAKCLYCGKCAHACPMAALTIDMKAKTWSRRAERCIGCGLCAVACDKARALRMEPVGEVVPPYRNILAMMLRAMPPKLARTWQVWRKRK